MSDRNKVLYDLADKTYTDMLYIAPEDVAMKRTKILDAMLRVDDPLRQIHRLMSGHEWDSDTLNAIAHILYEADLPVGDPE